MKKQVIKQVAQGHTGSSGRAGTEAQVCLLNPLYSIHKFFFTLGLKPRPLNFQSRDLVLTILSSIPSTF